MKQNNLKISGIMLTGVIVIVSFVYVIDTQPAVIGNPHSEIFTGESEVHTNQLMSFSSYEEFTEFLGNYSYHLNSRYCYFEKGVSLPNIMMDSAISVSAIEYQTIDFSETNIQVEGVDEPDVVKTDGKYLYIVSGQKVYIIKAWPSVDAIVVSNISVDFSISNIFINEDRLIIFGTSYEYYYDVIYEEDSENTCIPSPWYSTSNTYIKIYDIENREKPELKRDIVVGGNFYNARMIDNYIYVITRQYSYHIQPCFEDNETIIPLISINGEVKKIPLSDILCIDVPNYGYTLTHVVSVNVKNDSEEVVDKIFTLGNSQTMYVSRNNIYITYQISRSDYFIKQQIIDEVVFPILPNSIKENIKAARTFDISDYNRGQIVDWILDSFYLSLDVQERNEIQAEIEIHMHRTVIHKISVENGKIHYICNGTVSGYILNQFSMDEHNGFLRIASQIQGYWRTDSQKTTNVYILNGNLNLVGKVEGIAPGENLHSARFLGDKAYLVTFKKVDPFFTLDLSDPYYPRILGELKIPGYSDYLHPYDENHIIGIGKETVEPQEEYSWTRDFAWYQGLKIALFDVSDFENPKEVAKIIIGDRGTDSSILWDHKAFLFNREKELLVLPVSLYEIADEIKEQNDGYTGNTYGQFKIQGAFVYKLSLENGFEFRGTITHMDENNYPNDDYYWRWDSSSHVTRSLYIEDVLYTISNNIVKLNSLDDLSEINIIKLV
jgi:uncharacterized secreted protein with C-terminal beta-propeller domain